jgi:hypothetical protein
MTVVREQTTGRPTLDQTRERLLGQLGQAAGRGVIWKEVLTDGAVDSSDGRTRELPIENFSLNRAELRILEDLVDEGLVELFEGEKTISLRPGTKNRQLFRARLFSGVDPFDPLRFGERWE